MKPKKCFEYIFHEKAHKNTGLVPFMDNSHNYTHYYADNFALFKK